MSLLVHFKNKQELLEPFSDEEFPLKLISLETKLVSCPHLIAWKTRSPGLFDTYCIKLRIKFLHMYSVLYLFYLFLPASKMDAVSYSRWFVKAVKTVLYASFCSALSKDRSEKDRIDIMDTFFSHLEECIAAAPEDYAASVPTAVLSIKKTE